MITRITITPGKNNPIPPAVTVPASRLTPSPAQISQIGAPGSDPHLERAVRAERRVGFFGGTCLGHGG
jgi:hypothetical protein